MTGSMRWWFAAFVVAVFLAGTSVGIVVDRAWLLRRGGEPSSRTDVMPPSRRPVPLSAAQRDRLAAANLNRLQNRLRLTEEQRTKARPILEAWQLRVTELQTSARQDLRETVAALERDLSAILTPDQQQRLSMVTETLLVPNLGGRGGRGPAARGSGSNGAQGPGRRE